MEKFKDMPFEPKRNNRFLVEFPKQFNIQQWSIQKINKPKFTGGNWENIKIEFVDPIGPSTSQGLFQIVEFLKNNKNESKCLFEIKIKSLDPTGVEVEEWVVYIGEILTINFGELDYGDDKIQQPFLVAKPLNCLLKY